MIAIMAGCGGGGNTGNANSGNANAGNASSAANNQGGAVAQAASQAAAQPAAQSAAKPSSSLSASELREEKRRLEELERYKAYVKTINANPAECSAYDYSFTEKGAEELFDYVKTTGETKSAKGNAARSIGVGMSNKIEGIFYFTKNYADVTDMLNKYFESEEGQHLCEGSEKYKKKVINMINNVAKAENSNVWFIITPNSSGNYEFMVFLENGNVFRTNSGTNIQGLFGFAKNFEEEKMHKQYAQYWVDDNGKIDLKN